MFSPGSLGNYLQACNKERSKAINELTVLIQLKWGVGYFYQQAFPVDLIDTDMNPAWTQCIIHNLVRRTDCTKSHVPNCHSKQREPNKQWRKTSQMRGFISRFIEDVRFTRCLTPYQLIAIICPRDQTFLRNCYTILCTIMQIIQYWCTSYFLQGHINTRGL